MELTLSIFIDVIVLVMLAITIFYALRLSQSLNSFKKNKSEFEKLILQLSGHIEKAYNAIDSLKTTSKTTASELDEAISEARFLLDELKQVNGASDNLAARLEKLAQQTSKSRATALAADIADLADISEDDRTDTLPASNKQKSWSETLPKPNPPLPKSGGGFAIRDPDFGAGDNDPFSDDPFDDEDASDRVTSVNFKREDKNPPKKFASKAEQDLYESLQKKTKGK